jgi:glycosyltransferase involved in cell wall biosynthesis
MNSSLSNFRRPRVSVVMPTYNRADFVLEAIDSVLSQSYSDFELIVVDDGSVDNTKSSIEKYTDERLIYIGQKNMGRSNARNRALSQARGDYIAFLDSDDMYLPGKLALQVEFLDEHPEIGMLYTSAICVDEAGADLNFSYVASVSGHIYKEIAFFQPVTITLPTVMVRKGVLEEAGNFDESMSRFEDTDMWRRISKITYIHGMDVATCKLRTHTNNSLGSQNPESIVESIKYYSSKIMSEDANIHGVNRRKGLANLYLYYGRAFLTIPAWKSKGRSLIITAYFYWPPYIIMLLWKRSKARASYLARAVYFRSLNRAYSFYSRLKAPFKRTNR